MQKVIELINAQKELIDFYEHMIRKNSAYLMVHNIRWLDADIIKWEELREKIESLLLSTK